MAPPNNNSSFLEESDADRRRGLLAEDALSLDVVSALAGDRPLTNQDRKGLDEIRHIRGTRFFSDILYSITHQYFPPEVAEDLWVNVLRHKNELSATLGRNVGIVVAALDYLSNITTNMGSATLVGEAHIGEIVGLSLRDGLTGLFNHTYFSQQIDFEVRRYVRYGTQVSLALVDIDNFKQVNDVCGHQEGDRILAAMGKFLMHVARDSDIPCRYGGEELALILPMTDAREAAIIANRLKVDLAQHLPDGKVVTVSIGVASCGKNTESYRQLVEAADTGLYRAKRSGKNRVVVMDADGAVAYPDGNTP